MKKGDIPPHDLHPAEIVADNTAKKVSLNLALKFGDADHGKDLAMEVREYYIPDFSNWKNHDDFEREFNRLYESLKAEA